MAPKGAVFWRFSARSVGLGVTRALSWKCGAALGPAGREGLRFSAFRADDAAASQVGRNR